MYGYDPSLGYLYVAAEAGVVSLFKIEGGKTSRVGEGLLGPNANVVAVDPDTHLSYFPRKDVGGKTTLRSMRSGSAGAHP